MENQMASLYYCFEKRKEGQRAQELDKYLLPLKHVISSSVRMSVLQSPSVKGNSCQVYNTCTRAQLSLRIFPCNLNVLQASSSKV